MKQEKRETRPLCPLAGFAECRGERCTLWDDDWAVCSLSSGSRYSGVRAAVCDAAVEVMGSAKGTDLFRLAYGQPPSPEGEGLKCHDGPWAAATGAVMEG